MGDITYELPGFCELRTFDIEEYLSVFNSKHEALSTPVNLMKEDYKKLWEFVFRTLNEISSEKIFILCLKTLRILSRNKEDLNDTLKLDQVAMVIEISGLKSLETDVDFDHQTNYDVVLEAQKCMSNMIYNSRLVLKECCSDNCINSLVHRLRNFKDPKLPLKVKSFYIRILFLLSALCSDLRSKLYHEYHCISYLVDAVLFIYEFNSQGSSSLIFENQRSEAGVCFTDEQSCILVDILKALYNIATAINRICPDEEESTRCIQLLRIIRCLLLAKGSDSSSSNGLHCNSANLLLLLPPKLYEELLTDIPKQAGVSVVNDHSNDALISPIVEYDGKDVSAVVALLDLLHLRLSEDSTSSKENLTPILTLFVELTQNVRIIRKFVRLRILPPLRDVSKRPEDGSTIRNKLCLLMTSPVPDWSYLSSSLLFILCKENVNRLIKYTGYGNAAGLLASRGLMASNTKISDSKCSVAYSSDSEDSDTEEYNDIKDKVNPVTGYVEVPKPSTLDEMSEEQKEYETMKLVDALDKLARNNLIQPCAIGEDGKPHPIENVMQLQENILQPSSPDQQLPENNEETEDTLP